MDSKITVILIGIILALGGWNLNQTFQLSIEINQLKSQYVNIEKSMKQVKNQIAKLNKKQKNSKVNSIIQQN
jgi:predicted  nucleic acid-binding Zn-ribbon protein